MTNYLSPIERIVGVGWNQGIRYIVRNISDNAASGHTETLFPEDPGGYTGPITVAITDQPVSVNPLNYFYSTAPLVGYHGDINSIAKRKALIDANTGQYTFLSLVQWRGSLSGLAAFSVLPIFFIGKYILDHPEVSDYFYTTSGFDNHFLRPDGITRAALLDNSTGEGCTDWGLAVDGLDGGPFPIPP